MLITGFLLSLTLQNLLKMESNLDNLTEIWKPVYGFQNYLISSTGRVKSLPIKRHFGRYIQTRKEKYLYLHKEANGYIRVVLCRQGLCLHFGVHRLVAAAFIPNPLNKPTVNHKNGIKHDNRVENLEWATRYEQMAHADNNGLRNVKGESCCNAKLTDNDVINIRESSESAAEIAVKYNLHSCTVRRIRNRKTWKHL